MYLQHCIKFYILVTIRQFIDLRTASSQLNRSVMFPGHEIEFVANFFVAVPVMQLLKLKFINYKLNLDREPKNKISQGCNSLKLKRGDNYFILLSF